VIEPGPLWLREAEVVELLALDEAIDALESGLRVEGRGGAEGMPKTHVALPGGGGLHALGASDASAGFAGTKTWAHTASGATPLLAIWSSATGALEAVVEAFALGQMRTGAMTGLATRWLARGDADELAQIGTGKQARTQVAAVAAVRRLRRVRVYSPTRAHREAFADELRAEAHGFEVVACDSLERALDGASIATVATRARAPFVFSRALAAGAHLNAIGAITAERAELAQDVLPRCTLIAVDVLAAARELSAELIGYHGRDPAAWSQVRELAQLIANDERRPPGADLTLFKALGSGVADLALGIEVVARARRAGAGRPIEPPIRARVRTRFGDPRSGSKE
jgi:ornithine cyclodeaminase